MTTVFLQFCLLIAPASTGEPTVDFDTQIMPVLSVAGCNSATCHGSAAGQAGFHLSLFGGDAGSDYQSVAREYDGRRINLQYPADSLLLRKATGQLAHGGEQRIEPDSPSARLLERWIEQGAERQRQVQLERIELEPAVVTLSGPTHFVSPVVWAWFSDGTRRDVSQWSTYWTSDDTALEQLDNGRFRLTRPGRYWVFVRFLAYTDRVPILAPIEERSLQTDKLPRANWIDDRVNATLAELGLAPSPSADDATFVRRVYLDLTGRLPPPAVAQSFILGASADKREALIHELIESPEFVDFWTYRIAQWLRFHSPANDRVAAERFRGWLREQVARDRGWDQMVREMLVAQGDSQEVGPASFHRLVGDARLQAEYFSEVMLGVRLRCANCHNHPLDHWTQDDYHGLAQVFASIERGQVVTHHGSMQLMHPRTGEPVVPRIPGRSNPPTARAAIDELTAWLLAADNPYFARAFVGRVWRSLMGVGLIDPVDDSRRTNPPSDERLLAALIEEFRGADCRLRPLVTAICQSAAYQRSAGIRDQHDVDGRDLSHARRRPLSAEVLTDALTDVTGVSDVGSHGARAIHWIEPGAGAETLLVLGGCVPGLGCVPETTPRAMNLAARLQLVNGPVINSRLSNSQGNLAVWIQQAASDNQIIDRFYWLALSRAPNDIERQYWIGQLTPSISSTDRQLRLQDFVWSLLNCQEFLTNH